VIANDFVTRWHGREDELRGDLDTMKQRYRTALEEDDYDIANMTVGESIGLIHRVRLAEEIVESMVRGAEASLQGALA
jgi:nitronate monooxygenase